VRNCNDYFCKHNVRKKKEIWDSTFFRLKNANELEIKGISAAGAFVASQFSNTAPSILGLKSVRPFLNVTKQDTSCGSDSKFYHEQLSSSKLNQNLDYLIPINSKVPSCHVMSTAGRMRSMVTFRVSGHFIKDAKSLKHPF
jgi:hypothetical protein